VKAELLVLAAVTVTLVPLAVNVPVAVPLEPTVTLPRASVAGDTVSCPTVVVTPVPVIGMVKVEFVAVDVMVRFPFTAPADVGENETVNVALCPPVSVSGVVIPLTLSPVPVIPSCETDTLVVPVFVMVSDRVPLLPTFTLPNPRLVGFALSAPAVTPVPDNDIVNVGLEASEVIVTVPLALPLAVGVKVIVKVVLWDAASDSGAVIPLIAKLPPPMEICEIDTLDESPLVRVTLCDLLAPTVTLPKASVVGFTCSKPVPAPESDTVTLGFDASLVMLKVPLNVVAALGVNEMLRAVLRPAPTDTGNVGDASEKYLDENDIPLMVTDLFPEFVAVSMRVLLVPGLTFPKFRLALPRTNVEDCWPEPEPD
jgi:hypothetical protein